MEFPSEKSAIQTTPLIAELPVVTLKEFSDFNKVARQMLNLPSDQALKLAIPELMLVRADEKEEKAKERKEQVEEVAKRVAKDIKKDGKLTDETKEFIIQTLVHQYEKNGGADSADKLAKEISDTLPKGMKLKIVDEPGLRKAVEEDFKQNKMPVPDYIRVARLYDEKGDQIGASLPIVFSTKKQID